MQEVIKDTIMTKQSLFFLLSSMPNDFNASSYESSNLE